MNDEKTAFFALEAKVDVLMTELEDLRQQVARLQDVRQCLECLAVFNTYGYGDHRCLPVWVDAARAKK